MDQSLRLRLVVRRHGLPEARILFNVPLDNDPTIAQLVELVNESIPLESDDWGLDDYTVELHAKDGHAFECLHFQSVASILEKDDEIFIRPLLTNDLKRRRISGRDQISSGGQHLIDGVPFGRPRLRAPRGRPAIHIAPRKRRRLTYDGDFDQDEFDDNDQGEDGDGELAEYLGPSQDQDDEEDEEPLLLTQHGESKTRRDNRRVHFPRSITASADFEDTDGHDETSESEGDTEAEEDQDEDMFEPDSEDLREELRGLAEEAAGSRPAEEKRDDLKRSRSRNDGADESPSVRGELKDFGPFTEEDSEPESPIQSGQPSASSRDQFTHDVSDKVIAVRSAFPAVSGDVCEKLLVKHNHDVGSVWKKLAQQLKPRLDLAQTMVLNTQLELPKEVMVISSPPRKPAEAPGEVSRIGDEDDDATDGTTSADEEEAEEEDGSEAGATSSESEDDESSDSDTSGEDDSAPRPQFAKNGDGSSSSSSDESGSSDGGSRNREHATNPNAKAKGGKRAGSNENENISGPRAGLSSGLTSRRRRNVIESSPTSSRATDAKSDSRHGNDPVPSRAASPSDNPPSESSSDDSSSDDSDESSSDDSDEDIQAASSDSSSASSSSSDSSSESEAEVATPCVTKRKAASHSQRLTTATSSSLKPGPKSITSQSFVQMPVPPGQGLTKTQRRNARRRIQKAAQRASESVKSPQVSTAQDADLMAKKQALLQSLNVPPGVTEGCDKPAADRSPATSLENAPKDINNAKEDPDAWREKISYRAVECVNEGVELSEPPFPFVQRWDSSQRRGKRKSRDDSQFYDGSKLNPKKRKCDRSSRQPADACRQDTTTFTLNQEDVTLNYDDEPIGLDQGRMDFNNTGTDHTPTADEDDLPSLPVDVSSLPQLSTDDIQPGLIIAWKQLLLTKANSWQPQLSNFMTAVVTEVDSVGDFQVQLAKRDRDVDKNEKEYDDEGERVYAKFEVPDDDEGGDEEVDLGFRDISFAEMIDPRIVQRPSLSTTETTTSQPPRQDVEVADSQPGHKGGTSNESASNGDQSMTMDMEQDGQGDQVTAMDVDSTDGHITAEASFVSETNHDVIADNEMDVGAQLESLAQDVSISEERRNEISQLINEGGFRQGVRSSIDRLTFLQFGSPSRQLEEEASSMLPSRQMQPSQRASSEDASEDAPSEYGSKDPSQQEAHLPAVASVLDDFHSAFQSPRQLGAKSDNEHEDGSAFGQTSPKGDVEYPKLDISFPSQTSALSGRQIDPDFITHSGDLGHGLPDDSVMMNGFDDDDAQLNDSNPVDERGQVDVTIQQRTPTQEIYNDDLLHAQDAVASPTPFKSTKIGPEGNDRPGSAGSASTGSSSVFVDFELLGSQPAMTKFKERIKEETAGSQTMIKGEQSSQATQGMTRLPDINDTHPPVNTRPRSPESGRSQGINGTPASQRSRRLARSVQQSPQDPNDEGSVSQRTRRSSRLMNGDSSSPVATKAETGRNTRKHNAKGSPTPNGKPKSLIASFDVPVSPPALSKLRQKPARAPSSSPGGKGQSAKRKRASFKIPAGSQVMSLSTSSPEPQVDESSAERKDGDDEIRSDSDPDDPFAEVAAERYADDDIDEDYHDSATGSVPSTINKLRPRRSPSTRATRGASVPVAETGGTDEGTDGEWVPSTYQGLGGRQAPTGKIDGRWSSNCF